MLGQRRQSSTVGPSAPGGLAPTTDRSPQGRFGNAFLAERLNGRDAALTTEGPAPTVGAAAVTPEAPQAGGDASWANTIPTRQPNPAPAQPGRQEREVLGVQIVGDDVSPSALDACERFVRLTLANRPDIQERMRRSKVSLVIIPRNRKMTEVTEFAGLAGKMTFDKRPWSEVRGSGGRDTPGGRWGIAVPEENLVDVGGNADSYGAGYSVGLHELAHTIQSKGLSRDERRRVRALYEARKEANGPWTETYGASNEEEYFAQCTNCFFSVNTGVGQNGPAWLETNDRPMYDFLVRLYGRPPTPDAATAAAGSAHPTAGAGPAGPATS